MNFLEERFWLFFFLVLIIFTFVVSIIHLNKHKKKSFAIVSLVFSSIFMFLLLISAITSPSPNAVLIHEINQDVQKNYSQSYTMILHAPSYLNLNFSSDSYSNFYILEPNEYTRYVRDDSFYSIEKAENSTSYSFENSYFDAGTYYAVIAGINSSIKYNLFVDAYPA